MFNKILTTTALASLMAFSASSFAATTPVNKNGTFVGVNGIVIGSDVYNVSWSQPKDSSKLNWYTKKFAQKAAFALYKSLNAHINDTNWAFDDNGQHRFQHTGEAAAFLHTYWTNPSTLATKKKLAKYYHKGIALYSKQKDMWGDGYTPSLIYAPTNFIDPVFKLYDYDYVTTWTKVSAVPTPSAALMFAPALLGFAALRRKKRA